MKVYNMPPEFEKAVKVCMKKLEQYQHETLPYEIPSSIYKKTGSIVGVRKLAKIREIPSGNGWRWNQAKKRYSALSETFNLEFEVLKLVPRKSVKSNIVKLPKLKLWQVNFKNSNSPIIIYWCERGTDLESTSSDLDLDLEAYSFLAEFINPEVGKELWPNHPKYTSPSTFDELIEYLVVNE